MLVLDLKSGQEVCWMLTPRDQLLASHEEFQKLAQEHTQYAQRLDALTQKRYLIEDEKLEEVRLKKLKLRLNDQMESIEREYRQEYGVNVALTCIAKLLAVYPPWEQSTLSRARSSAFFFLY